MTHVFKIWPEYYRAVLERRKQFEVRKKRPMVAYCVGDIIILYEFDPASDKYTGRIWTGVITFVLDDERFCKEGFAILGIKETKCDTNFILTT